MSDNGLIARLTGKSIDMIYMGPHDQSLDRIRRPGVTGGILRDEDADCIVIEMRNGMREYLMKTAIIRIIPME